MAFFWRRLALALLAGVAAAIVEMPDDGEKCKVNADCVTSTGTGLLSADKICDAGRCVVGSPTASDPDALEKVEMERQDNESFEVDEPAAAMTEASLSEATATVEEEEEEEEEEESGAEATTAEAEYVTPVNRRASGDPDSGAWNCPSNS